MDVTEKTCKGRRFGGIGAEEINPDSREFAHYTVESRHLGYKLNYRNKDSKQDQGR